VAGGGAGEAVEEPRLFHFTNAKDTSMTSGVSYALTCTHGLSILPLDDAEIVIEFGWVPYCAGHTFPELDC
jgi:hypothetical protein